MPETSRQPLGVSPAHSCEHCRRFMIYLYDEPGPIRNDKPIWLQPNKSQEDLATKIFGYNFRSAKLEESHEEFYRVTEGISFWAASVDELKQYSRDGCSLSRRIITCLELDEYLPSNFAIGANITTPYSLELGILDLDLLRWENLLGEETEERGDNVYTMLTASDNPAVRTLDNQPVNPTPGSPSVLSTAKSWLQTCLESHDTCQRLSADRFMPTRLIQVLRHGSIATYRLCEPPQGEVEDYAALSYCWGGDQIFKTTTETISRYKEEIALARLPQTLQDALYITEQLGLAYIWIDSLCIVQNDNEDQSNEIAQMRRIYGSAAVTIAASRAKTAWDGFLDERQALGSNLPGLVFSLLCQCADGQYGSLTLVPLTSEATEPLDLRGWTFQERVLSNRVLDFGSLRTQWNCRTDQGFVSGDGWSSQALDNAYGSFGLDPHLISRLITGQCSQQDILENWMKITAGFSARTLSFPSDKLPAIAGLAESFGRFLIQEYLAGLWRSAMPACLLWSNPNIYHDSLTPRPPQDQVSAPSWSWAAIAGRVKYDPQWGASTDLKDFHFEVQVQGCQVSLLDENSPYGAVESGELVLRGVAQHAIWYREGIFGSADTLVAAGVDFSDEEWDLNQTSSGLKSTAIRFSPDALETDFLEDPTTGIEARLVLFGYRSFPSESGLYPTLFGLALRSLPGGTFSRLGLFTKTVRGDRFSRYLRWFRQAQEASFTVV